MGLGRDRQQLAGTWGRLGLKKGVAAGSWACAAWHAGQAMAVFSLELRRATMPKFLQLA